MIEIPVQVNGKLRDLMPIEETTSREEIEEKAIRRYRAKSKAPVKISRIVHVPGRLVNIITE